MKMRHRFRNEFEDYVQMYTKFERQANANMANVPHLTEEQRQTISDKCGVMQAYFMGLRTEMETKQRHEDLSASLSDIERKQTVLEAEVNSILNSKPPAPKKEEEKKEEEGAAAQQNEEMAEGEGEPQPEQQEQQPEQPTEDAQMQDEQPEAAQDQPAEGQ